MSREFWDHLKRVLDDGEARGMTITYVFPDKCNEAQMEGIKRIMLHRESKVCAVFTTEDRTFLVYNDVRYPSRLAYLFWDGGKWESPKGDALQTLVHLEPGAFN